MAASRAAGPESPLIDVGTLAGLLEPGPVAPHDDPADPSLVEVAHPDDPADPSLVEVAHPDHLADLSDPALVVLDIRWSLAQPDGRPAYLSGHLPGARYVDLEHELSGPADPAQGRHPLPRPGDLQVALREAGVGQDSLVVVYDDAGGLSAARAWWLLRWAGHPRVRLLDGGLAAWRAAGGAIETGAPAPSDPGDVVVQPGAWPTVSAEDVSARHPARVLIDSRAPERYRGDVEPVDPVAGHIPGAVNRPTTENLGPDGRFLDAAQLQAGFADLGVTPAATGEATPIVYCGSGVIAAHQLVAMEVAGLAGVLYAPSWSGWVSDPTRPVATAADLA